MMKKNATQFNNSILAGPILEKTFFQDAFFSSQTMLYNLTLKISLRTKCNRYAMYIVKKNFYSTTIRQKYCVLELQLVDKFNVIFI